MVTGYAATAAARAVVANFFDNAATVQFDHRLLAWLLAALAVVLVALADDPDTQARLRVMHCPWC